MVVAPLALCCLAGTASADAIFATGATSGGFTLLAATGTGNAVGGPNPTAGGLPDVGNVNANSTTGIMLQFDNEGTSSFSVQTSWTQATTVGNQYDLVMYIRQLPAGQTATVTQVVFSNGAPVPTNATATASGLSIALTGNTTRNGFVRNDLGIAGGAYVLANNFSFANGWNRVTFTITVTGGTAAFGGGSTNEWFEIDTVSNPEPGTLALFALGAMGLGGVVMRRRKKRRLAQAAPTDE